MPSEVQQVGRQDCGEILRAVEDELRKTTSQIVKATFSVPFCAVGSVPKTRQENYTYYAQIPYQEKVSDEWIHPSLKKRRDKRASS